MSIPLIGSLSTDVIIIAVLAFVVIYGVFMGHSKVRTLALSTYVGLVLSSELAVSLHGAVSSLSLTTAKLILYLAPVVLLEFGRTHHLPAARRGMIITMVLAVATAALLVSGFASQLDADGLKHFTGGSSLGYVVYNLRLVWLGAVPGLIVLEGFIKPKDKH